MNFRTLCGAFTLLLFVAPLSASFCGDCAPGHCMLTGESRMSEQSELRAESHCQEAESSDNAAAPCHSAAPAMASPDCCSIEATPEPETVAAPAGSVFFEIALEATPYGELPAAAPTFAEDQRQRPLRQVPQPLYTLHSAFLI